MAEKLGEEQHLLANAAIVGRVREGQRATSFFIRFWPMIACRLFSIVSFDVRCD